jgi:hypothetical protein
MATRFKVVEPSDADIAELPTVPDFDPAPTRKRLAGWTAERQRTFIDRLAMTGSVGQASAIVGVASSSAYRLRNRAGADGFARAWDAALRLATTRGTAIVWDRALNGRVERFYKDGELVMERRIPSDYLLTWLLSRLDPMTFGSPAARAHALVAGDPREEARKAMPALLDSLTDVAPEECAFEEPSWIDGRRGEMADDMSEEDCDRPDDPTPRV